VGGDWCIWELRADRSRKAKNKKKLHTEFTEIGTEKTQRRETQKEKRNRDVGS